MSIHPNAMLMLHLSPQDLPRKTWLAILEDADSGTDDARIKIGGESYSVILMDGDYEESRQVSGSEGEIVVMDMVTYGFGERIEWEKLAERRNALVGWLEANAVLYHLDPTPRISVGANYW